MFLNILINLLLYEFASCKQIFDIAVVVLTEVVGSLIREFMPHKI